MPRNLVLHFVVFHFIFAFLERDEGKRKKSIVGLLGAPKKKLSIMPCFGIKFGFEACSFFWYFSYFLQT